MAEYIEREAFLAEQRHLYCENCAKRKGMKNGKMKFLYGIGDAPCRSCGIGDVLDDVADFPAADVRPVLRGKWIDDGGNKACSECRKIWLYRKTNFCPNCGADMRIFSTNCKNTVTTGEEREKGE